MLLNHVPVSRSAGSRQRPAPFPTIALPGPVLRDAGSSSTVSRQPGTARVLEAARPFGATRLPGVAQVLGPALLIGAALLFGAFATPVRAETWTVEADGSGDVPDVAAALEAASDGDVIELGAGNFVGNGNRDLDLAGLSVTIRSASGDPSDTVLDAEGSKAEPHRVFLMTSGEGSDTVIEGVTVRDGVAPDGEGGGGVLCQGGSPTFRNVRFENNAAAPTSPGGAVLCVDGGTPSFFECEFTDNLARQGGALALIDGVSAAVEDSRFEANHAGFDGGAAFVVRSTLSLSATDILENTAGFGAGIFVDDGADVSMEDGLLAGNAAELIGGGMAIVASTARITRCTVTGNSASAFDFMGGGAGWCSFSGDLTVEDSILAFNLMGQSLVGEPGAVFSISCTDIFGNEGGNWVGAIEDLAETNGNLEENPLFCGAEVGDYQIAANSPCLPGLNECGVLMGAFGQGCDVVPIRVQSWGRMKTLFD